MSALSPAQIAAPLRDVLRRQRNTTVLMGEVGGVDKERQLVFVDSPDRDRVPVHYDYLILATGVSHSYFGHPEYDNMRRG